MRVWGLFWTVCTGCNTLVGLDELAFEGATGSGGNSVATTGGAGGQTSATVTAGGTGGTNAGGGGAPAGYLAAVLEDQPLALWRLGEAGGTKAIDAIGNAHEGLYVGGVTLGEVGALSGDSDTAVHFNGINGRVLVDDVFDFTGVAPFSLELWLQHDGLVDFQRVVSKELQAGMVDAQGYVVYLDDLGVLYFRRSTGAMSDQVSAPLSSGSYHHVVAAFTGSLIVLYVDGVAVDGKPSVLSIPDHEGAFTFGSKSDTFAPLAGTIDEMAVYDHALDAARVQVHHALGVMP